MGRPKKCPTPGYSTPAWMTTFGDMNNLLLTFFVFLIANMTPQAKTSDLQLILSAFTGNIGFLEGGQTLSAGKLAEGGHTVESLPSREVGTKLSISMKEMMEMLKPELRARKVRIDETQKGIKISLSSDLFFRPGSAEIDFEEGKETLRKIAMMIKNIKEGYKIDIIGHTDNTQIPRASEMAKVYPSNWELSTARASSVVRFLADFGVDPSIMKASGRGEYDPIESNATPEGRAYNRRVDIYISVSD
ncbi:MAG: OmpA family protein [Brevinematales bacterium]